MARKLRSRASQRQLYQLLGRGSSRVAAGSSSASSTSSSSAPCFAFARAGVAATSIRVHRTFSSASSACSSSIRRSVENRTIGTGGPAHQAAASSTSCISTSTSTTAFASGSSIGNYSQVEEECNHDYNANKKQDINKMKINHDVADFKRASYLQRNFHRRMLRLGRRGQTILLLDFLEKHERELDSTDIVTGIKSLFLYAIIATKESSTSK